MGHCEPNVFIFVTEKEAQNKFQTKKNIALLHIKRKKMKT